MAVGTPDVKRALALARAVSPFCGMLKLGLEAARSNRPLLLAVTVLTSIDSAELGATGVAGSPAQQVLRLARLAMSAGADGLVCSPLKVGLLRNALGTEPLLLVPGIRPEGAYEDDQALVMSPRQAIEAGADWIVVGRPVTGQADPGAAAKAVIEQLR